MMIASILHTYKHEVVPHCFQHFLIVNNADINFLRAGAVCVAIIIIIMSKTTTTDIFGVLTLCQAWF